VAPAGYGKSTLLAEWAHCDPRRFIPIVPGGGVDVEIVVEVALQDAADLPSVFVIDDAHSVPAPALRQLATAVLAELDSGSQLVIASRTEPSLPIGRLRAQRELVEIRTEDLAMSPAEAANLLRLAGLELDFASVQALSRETEGWPAGLYLAALSLRDQDDVRGALRRFAGDDHFVAEYFRDEVLAPLSRKRARFLTRASVLDELSGSVCDAVLEQTNAAGVLDELARSSQLLVPLDRTHERFRRRWRHRPCDCGGRRSARRRSVVGQHPRVRRGRTQRGRTGVAWFTSRRSDHGFASAGAGRGAQRAGNRRDRPGAPLPLGCRCRPPRGRHAPRTELARCR
jgi:LuxR family maltose regulon positive regulatory protein